MPQKELEELEHAVRGVLQLHGCLARVSLDLVRSLQADPAVLSVPGVAAKLAGYGELFAKHELENAVATDKVTVRVTNLGRQVAPPAGLRVVVAEDDPLVLADLCGMVRSCGHVVVGEAALASELTAVIEREQPDVAVFDVHLPDGDGLTAYRTATAGGRGVAGVAVTGDRGNETVGRAVENDVTAFVLKPVSPDQLRSAIQVAHSVCRRVTSLRAENAALSRAIDDDKGSVERAKLKLAEYPGLHARSAYQFLLRVAKDRDVTVVRAAEMVLKDEVRYGSYLGGERDRRGGS